MIFVHRILNSHFLMLRKNVFANLLNSAWGVVSVFLFIPLYIEFLGIEAYGIVAFYTMLLVILSLADMGFTVTLKREMARFSAVGDLNGMKDALRTYEIIYLLISILTGCVIYIFAPFIASYWLNTKSFTSEEMVMAIRLMGISIAMQLPAGLFIGGLMGLQRQLLANFINIGVGALRGAGAILVFWLFSPTIFVFFCWQLFANIVYLVISRYQLWNIISTGKGRFKGYFRWSVVRETGRFALGMASISLMGVVLTQADKLVVGKFASLEMFSYYSVAGTLASVPVMISSGIGAALFPRFTEIVALAHKDALKQVYNQACEAIGVLIIPVGLILVFFSGEFIYAWTGSTQVASSAQLTASLLLLGQILQSVTVIPYNFALAHGSVKFSQRLGVLSIALVSPLLIVLTFNYGILGAGVSWLVLNCLTFPISIYYLHRQVLSTAGMWKYCIRGVIRPLLISLPFILLTRQFLPVDLSRFKILLYLGIVWLVCILLSALSFPTIRAMIFKISKNLYDRMRGSLDR
jgi:O-antigen/teichoic acid export membrane protein